jgi:hypothetical protein
MVRRRGRQLAPAAQRFFDMLMTTWSEARVTRRR